jgi:Tol biopolymer transport system component
MTNFRNALGSVVMAVLLAVPLAAQKPAGAQAALNAAIDKEMIDGDLRGAIALYEKTVAEAKADRATAAKALIRMAECHHKLGDAEARKIYERVAREYGDQKEAVALARTWLDRSSAVHNSGIITRQVWANALDTEGAPSPDGQFLSFVDWTTGDLAIRDLTTGENRRLTNKGPWSGSEDFALDSVFSPDGGQIAYAWYNSKDKNSWELRIVPAAGGPSSQRVLYRNGDMDGIRVFDWSPDGKEILMLFRRKDRTHQIAMVSVTDGSVRILKTFDWRAPFKMSLSPNGRDIAYDFPPKEDSPERDIYVLASDAGRERVLLQDPASDTFPVWSPDGSRIVFVSDRTGSNGVWVVPVADGKATGQPELIKADVGPMMPMAFTRKRSLFYGLVLRDTTVYVGALDSATGKLTGPLAAVTRPYTGNNFSADWSPDGRQLAYFSRRGLSQQPGAMIICIRSSETGKERELVTRLAYIGGLRWSPNGRTMVIWGTDDRGKKGIFEFDVLNGAIAPIVATGEDFRDPVWSLDGHSLYYHSNRVVARNRDTGQERELVAGPLGINYMAMSRDGSKLALLVEHHEKRSMGIYVVPTTGGEAREILTLPEGLSGLVLEWEPSGRNLIFARAKNTELWRVSAEGGHPEKLDIGVNNAAWIRTFRFHPDGRHVAFTSGTGGKAEVWTLENFLPTVRAKQ